MYVLCFCSAIKRRAAKAVVWCNLVEKPGAEGDAAPKGDKVERAIERPRPAALVGVGAGL